jgi:hypothetical protein
MFTLTRISHDHSPPHRRQRPRAGLSAQRGIAMLLVLISLMMATVLATSYVSSRDNSASIGRNATAAASARWAAEAGMNFGAVILQTEASWRTSHVSGRLVSNYALSGAFINIDLLDLETNQPPNSATSYVKMTVTATVDGMKQTAVALARVPPSTASTVDVDLSEFAIFASDRLDMDGKATLARWPRAPLSVLGDRILVGSRAMTASTIALLSEAAALDTTVYASPGSSNLQISVATGQPPDRVVLPDPVPLPDPPDSGVASPGAALADVTQNGGTLIVNANARHNKLEVRSGGTRHLRGNITVTTDDDLKVTDNAKLLIDGNVKLVVFGDLELDKGSIELRPGARLTAFVHGNSGTAMKMHDGYVGEQRADSTRDATGAAPYMDPERITFYTIAGAPPEDWRIEANSVFKGSIYAPNAAKLEIRDTSAVYGRVASTSIKLDNEASLFYDPALNEGVGFTELTSPLYSDGRLKVQFATLASLDTSVIQAAADATNLLVKTVFGLLTPSGYSPTGPAPVPPTDPTPRPVQIQMQVVSIGDALKSWE